MTQSFSQFLISVTDLLSSYTSETVTSVQDVFTLSSLGPEQKIDCNKITFPFVYRMR